MNGGFPTFVSFLKLSLIHILSIIIEKKESLCLSKLIGNFRLWPVT